MRITSLEKLKSEACRCRSSEPCRDSAPGISRGPKTLLAHRTKIVAGVAFAVLLLVGGGLAISSAAARYRRMNAAIAHLSAEVRQVRQEQAMPSRVLDRYRNSICFIYAVYELPMQGHRSIVLRTSGTGF